MSDEYYEKYKEELEIVSAQAVVQKSDKASIFVFP